MITAKVIADSITPLGNRLVSLQLMYPRFIHAEFLTHRVFSRNSSSSRAIPVAKVIAQVRDNPAMPLHWGANQPGMQAKAEVADKVEAERLWRLAANDAANQAQQMMTLGLHKQVANRILEPFQFMHTIVSSTEWRNFMELRDHKDADPNIAALAVAIKDAMASSTPILLMPDSWHLPYVSEEENLATDVACKVSAARCARVSYLTHDQQKPSIEKDLELFDRLAGSRPMHCFSSDTEVLTKRGFIAWPEVTEHDELADVSIADGSLVGWAKPSRLITTRFTGNMYTVDGRGVSFRVTDGHTMLGHLVTDSKSRYSKFSPSTFTPGTPTSVRHTKRTLGEVECRMLTAPVVIAPATDFGKLVGMYLGDGYKIDTTIGFHFSKPRKISYLEGVLSRLGLQFSSSRNSDGTVSIRVYKCDTTDTILNTCGYGSATKVFGNWGLEHMTGIFDGLKNSDGSVKRNTWSYCTGSSSLFRGILDAAPLAGITAFSNRVDEQPKTPRHSRMHHLMVQTTNLCRVNDSRNLDQSGVRIEEVCDEIVYCATMPSGALVVRRNGKTLVAGNCSPLEHQATPYAGAYGTTGNFNGWTQYRKLWEQTL